MAPDRQHVVVAGHICLDIIPTLEERAGGLADLLVPGSLTVIGPATISTGGAVSNTGLALHRLGLPTRLMGKVGDDVLGDAILSFVRGKDPALAEGMIVTPGEPSSYTLVINPPNIDRIFLHCPGANDTFAAADIPYERLRDVRLFHFGYPPIMRRFYADGGRELAEMFRQVKARGVATSLDMAYPDPNSPSGRTDWHGVLTQTLPHVDVFLPSIEEILYMLDRERFDRLSTTGDIVAQLDGELLRDVAAALLEMGVAVLGIKLGDRGFYVRTTENDARLDNLRGGLGGQLDHYVSRELMTPCFVVDVAGATGCGDTTIAGFLAALLHDLPPADAMQVAVAVGACTAEQPDATSGVRSWDRTQARIAAGWEKHASTADWPGWGWDERARVARGPADRA